MRKAIYIILTAIILAACSKVDDNVLSAPSDVDVRQTGLKKVTLTWKNESRSYDGVIIERATWDGAYQYQELARISSGTFVYEDCAHDGDAEYQYRLTTCSGSAMSGSVVVSFKYSMLPAPSDVSCEMTPDGLLIRWKDNCAGEEGYAVRKRTGDMAFEDWKSLQADAVSVIDPDVSSGSYDYEIYAYAGQERSAVAAVHYESFYAPKITIGNTLASWYQVCIPFVMNDDGGYDCEAGICWRNDGGKGAMLTDNVFAFPGNLRTGDVYFGSAAGLEYGRTYSFRPWVRYGDQIKYYAEINASLHEEPSSLTAVWDDVSVRYSLPESIRLYKTTLSIKDRNVKAWYAVADMSAGDLELRTVASTSPIQPSAALKSGLAGEKVHVMINGGLFEGDESLSYVLNRGVEEAEGVRSVRCSYYTDADRTGASRTYNVTRGAFGVDVDQNPSVKWLYGSYKWAYDTPLPNFVSGPVKKPTETFPGEKHTWRVYSAVGGAPVILHDGRLCFDYLTIKDKGGAGRHVGNHELIGEDVFGPSVRIPRTAIGHTADGRIVLMVVESVSLDELACLMKGIGCTYALNLDGGDSTVMCVSPDAKVINLPSDGAERPVVSFVALTEK